MALVQVISIYYKLTWITFMKNIDDLILTEHSDQYKNLLIGLSSIDSLLANL